MLITYQCCRYLCKLKNNVRNKTRVEGSICNAYIVEESSFCSYHFKDHVNTRHKNVLRNYEGGGDSIGEFGDNLSIFKHPGGIFGRVSDRRRVQSSSMLFFA